MTFPRLEAKDPNHDTEYALDARSLVTGPVLLEWPYGTGAIFKAQRHTGFYYEVTVAGETPANYPQQWPRADGEVFTFGSTEITTRHPGSSSLPSVSSIEWAVDDSDLSVSDTRIENAIVYPMLAGGVGGVDYELTATITWSNGAVDDVTVVIPVEQQ